MDPEQIRALVELMDDCGISELEVRSGDDSVRIVRALQAGAAQAGAAPIQPASAGRAPAGPVAGQPLRAPMAGTFYAAPEPGAEPFVAEGQAVAAGDVLCIIESMKMMNEIKAEHAGTCTAVGVANGQPVSAGDVLFVIA